VEAVYNRWTGLLDWTTGLDYWTGLLDSPKFHERSFSALFTSLVPRLQLKTGGEKAWERGYLFTAELPDSRRDIELPKKPKRFRGYVFHVGAHQELPSKRLAT